MPTSVAASRLRSFLVLGALSALPMVARAQRQAAPADQQASQDSVVILESVRVRTGPSPQSLSIDDVSPGSRYAIESGSALNGPWIAIRFDERTAFVPRQYVTMKLVPRAPTTAATSPAPTAPAPAPSPAAVAIAEARSVASVRETPAPVRQAPAPAHEAPAAAKSTPAPIQETPAPVRQAGAPTVQASPEPRRENPAPARATTPTPSQAPASAPAATSAPSSTSAPPAAGGQTPASPKPDPGLKRPRLGLPISVALLGSVTPYTVTTTGAKVLHLSGNALVTLNVLGWGLYAAPEYGSGAGHRSTMLGGGVLRQIVRTGPVHVAVLAGATVYSEVPDGPYAASFVSRTIRAGSVGGVVTLPFVGPARIGYRGQYLRGLGADSDFHKIRHAVGLFF